ncbi:MAG: 16S rRNA (guanine(527)-N(7))-methyltransferase RsmG [Gammaproteobacteria bacterium]|nr:16S rRNA (guanine(527)-N(7))-methyltransferase RsmG [Gammaproteobacteria bacterium]
MRGLDAVITDAAAAVGVALSRAQSDLLMHYTELVFKWNRIANLTGAKSSEDFIIRHIADCLTIVPYVVGTQVLDLGSGAGLPGIVLACVTPNKEITLVEPRGKRARFLEQVRIELALRNVEVAAVRLENWQPDRPVDTFICRAFGSLSEFLAATHAGQTLGCRLIAMKGRDPAPELAAIDSTAYRTEVQSLTVPGWESRHLVICDRLVA